jgi:putative alpha-1,2-mannosidase
VQSVTVNGALVNGVEVSHQSIVEGAKLVFAMTNKPTA